MDAIGQLSKFADGHESAASALAPLMRSHRIKPPKLVTDTITQDMALSVGSDAVRLRQVWDAEKNRPGAKISQKAMAVEWGVNASNITQYLNGHIKLNTEAKLRFAAYLKKPVVEIWPDFDLAGVAPGELSSEAVLIASMWTRLPETARKAVFDLIRSLSPPVSRGQ